MIAVLVCENEIHRDGVITLCGHWIVMTRGDELPHCYSCKRPDRCWRIATEEEIRARDEAFLKAIERLGCLGPDRHLGAAEQS